jgi:hypothetical protein
MNKKLLYAGAGIFLFLVIISSLKPVKLVEVYEPDNANANFDASKLPEPLRPPEKINEGEEMPKRHLPMKNFSNLTLKPRFDT